MARGACRRGFTLVELLIALAIVAALVVLGLQNFRPAQTQANQNAQMAQAQALAQAVSAFYAVNGCYPADVGPGTMPPGLSPYVGGPWPAGYDYNAWSSTSPPTGVGSGGTAMYIFVSDLNLPGSPSVWIVQNQPVPVC